MSDVFINFTGKVIYLTPYFIGFGQRFFKINAEAVPVASFLVTLLGGVCSGKIESAQYCFSSVRLILHTELL